MGNRREETDDHNPEGKRKKKQGKTIAVRATTRVFFYLSNSPLSLSLSLFFFSGFLLFSN